MGMTVPTSGLDGTGWGLNKKTHVRYLPPGHSTLCWAHACPLWFVNQRVHGRRSAGAVYSASLPPPPAPKGLRWGSRVV